MSTRRDFIRTSAVAAGSVAFGAAFTAPACDKKDLSGQVVVLITSFNEIRPLLPDLGLPSLVIAKIAELLERGARIAKQFDEAYKAGKFNDARTLFLNLGEVITTVVTELGAVNNRIVKAVLVGMKIAQIVIANLLKAQMEEPAVAAAIRSRGGVDARAVNEVERLANADVERLLKLLP